MASTARLDAAAVASATFAAARRGYDPEEVRAYLRALSARLRDLETEVVDLRAQLAHRESPVLDEAAVAAALGEEAARVLTTARDAAGEIRARAQTQADEVTRVAHEDAERIRRDADLDAAQRRTDASNESNTIIEEAKAEGREMLAEARAVRERMLDDLARRRERGREQLAALRASHERVLRALETASASLSIAATDVRDLGPDVGAVTADDWSNDSGPIPIVTDTFTRSGMTPVAPAASTGGADDAGDGGVDADDDPPPVTRSSTAPASTASSPDVAAIAGPPPAIEVVVPLRSQSPDMTLTVVRDGSDVAPASAPVAAAPVAAAPVAAAPPSASPAAEESSLDEAYLRTFSLGELPGQNDDEPGSPRDYSHDGAHDSTDGTDDEVSQRASMPSADDVFARIRAARESLRTATVTTAPSSSIGVLDPDTPGPHTAGGSATRDDTANSRTPGLEPVERLLRGVDEPKPPSAPVTTSASHDTVESAAGRVADPLRPTPAAFADDVLAARHAALAPVSAAVARRLKRVLADEQNDVLDQLRRTKAHLTVDGLFGSLAEHEASYRRAIDDDLWDAVVAGALSLRPELADARVEDAIDRAAVLAVVGDDLVADLVDPLRERVARCIAEGDSAAAADLARAAYREWKVQRIDEIANHLSLHAFGRGAFAALAPGTSVCWAVDPTAPPCPDGDDNVLAGALTSGSPFPTGHLCAPAYPGCHCVLVRA